MADDIPQWALERASELAGYGPASGVTSVSAQEIGCAFARYIAEHEEPPVDPLLIEARKICAKHASQNGWDVEPFRLGQRDETQAFRTVMEALKRGMELAK